MDNSFEVNGRKFKLGKIDAFRQFHIVRRIGPILAEMVPAFADIKNAQKGNKSEAEQFEEFAKVLQPVMNGLSKLSDEDADYVLYRLLGAVEVHQPQFNSWARVSSDTALAIQDLELPLLLQVAGRSLMFNLSGFFALLPQK